MTIRGYLDSLLLRVSEYAANLVTLEVLVIGLILISLAVASIYSLFRFGPALIEIVRVYPITIALVALVILVSILSW